MAKCFKGVLNFNNYKSLAFKWLKPRSVSRLVRSDDVYMGVKWYRESWYTVSVESANRLLSGEFLPDLISAGNTLTLKRQDAMQLADDKSS